MVSMYNKSKTILEQIARLCRSRQNYVLCKNTLLKDCSLLNFAKLLTKLKIGEAIDVPLSYSEEILLLYCIILLLAIIELTHCTFPNIYCLPSLLQAATP